jgi:hypothetical protein
MLLVQISDEELEKLIRATVEDGVIPESLTGASHVTEFLYYLEVGYSLKDSHVLPISHAFLLGVCKTYMSSICDIVVQWGGHSLKLKTVIGQVCCIVVMVSPPLLFFFSASRI